MDTAAAGASGALTDSKRAHGTTCRTADRAGVMADLSMMREDGGQHEVANRSAHWKGSESIMQRSTPITSNSATPTTRLKNL